MENSRYKFRAWDTEEKEMLEVVALYFETMEMRYLNKQGKVETIDHANVYVSRGDDKYTTIVRSLKGLEIMQYTGLKDRNGVEIYEGDVVKAGDIVRHIKDMMGKELAELAMQNFWINDDNHMEVIGNIYENPELIKGE